MPHNQPGDPDKLVFPLGITCLRLPIDKDHGNPIEGHTGMQAQCMHCTGYTTERVHDRYALIRVALRVPVQQLFVARSSVQREAQGLYHE